MKEQRASPKLRPDLYSTCLKAHVTTLLLFFVPIFSRLPFSRGDNYHLTAVSAATAVVIFDLKADFRNPTLTCDVAPSL